MSNGTATGPTTGEPVLRGWDSTPDGAADPELVRAINLAVGDHPLHRFCSLELVGQEPGRAVLRFPVDENTGNIAGVLHGGALYAVMDVACFAALVPMLAGNERAVSHDVHVSVLRPVPKGGTVELRSQVERRGRSIAFMRVEAWHVDGPDGPKLIGTGTVTKSILTV